MLLQYLKKLEDGLCDEAIIECSTQDCAELSVQLESPALEVLVVLDERLVHWVQAVVGSVAEHPIKFLQQATHV